MSYYFLDPCENSTCSQVVGEESLAECFSDIPASVLSRLNLTAAKSCCNGSEMGYCQDSQYGIMSAHLMENHGEDELMLFAEGFHAKTSALPEKEKESTESEADCGEKWPEWFAKLDRNTCSWKIRQLWLFEDLDESLAIWPKWGMMRDGVCLDVTTPVNPDGYERESGYLPSPKATDYRKWTHGKYTQNRIDKGRGMDDLPQAAVMLLGGGDGKIGPQLPEWMMDWPTEWTDLKPLETAKFARWWSSHGKPSAKD